MEQTVLDSLKGIKTLSHQNLDLGSVPTGSYALNKIISGSYVKGIPIGAITQFHGEESTAKTVFVTHILREAQELEYYTALLDSENAYNEAFAVALGLDPEKLIYDNPETLEGCFTRMEEIIQAVREHDKDTPIVIGYDSIAVSPTEDELAIDPKKETIADRYSTHNMEGAIRARITGSCLRKINTILKREKVALVVVNQTRSKVGVMYGNPETKAAGGNSLKFYIGVDLRTSSSKTNDLIEDEFGNTIGITGKIKNKKNKTAFPFQECEFSLAFNKGLDPYYGLFGQLAKEGICNSPSKGWRGITGTEVKFREAEFSNLLLTSELPEFQKLRTHIGI